jgi:hypothetical protein
MSPNIGVDIGAITGILLTLCCMIRRRIKDHQKHAHRYSLIDNQSSSIILDQHRQGRKIQDITTISMLS